MAEEKLERIGVYAVRQNPVLLHNLLAALNEEVKELRSQFVDMRSDVQRLKLESKITEILMTNELYPSETPPKKIKVKSVKEEY